ncbi:MobA/MobL family protein (plasmid) [Bacillus megaterium]|nr:MobA/MobL family protein [Priestia megaterium]
MVADIAIHRDDTNNPHAHIMLTMRNLSEDGFGKRTVTGMQILRMQEKTTVGTSKTAKAAYPFVNSGQTMPTRPWNKLKVMNASLIFLMKSVDWKPYQWFT